MPSRADFKPAAAARFLHNIILVEAPGEEGKSLKVRVAGQLFQGVVAHPVAGSDYLDVLPSQYHDGALASVRLMVVTPCGLWQVMPVHLKGISRLVEFTAFPLAPGNDGIPLVLGFMLPLEDLTLAPPLMGQEIRVDTAVEFLFIDVGAGAPQWPAGSA